MAVVKVEPGQTVVEERRVRVETHPSRPEGVPGDNEEFFLWLEEQPAEVWRKHDLRVRLYRGSSMSGVFLSKWSARPDVKDQKPPFSVEVIEQQFGGGQYCFVGYCGSQLWWKKVQEIGGAPKTPEGGSASGGNNVVAMLIERMDRMAERLAAPQKMLEDSYQRGLAIQAQAMQSNNFTAKDVIEIMEKSRTSAAPAVSPLLGQVFQSLIPVVVGVLGKMIEPKDAVQTIATMVDAMNKMREAVPRPAAAPEPSIAIEMIRSGPSLLSGVSQVLDKLKQAETLRLQNEAFSRMARAPQSPPPVAAAARSAPPAGAPPNPSETDRFFDWVSTNIYDMVKRGDSGEFVCDWLDQTLSTAYPGQATILSGLRESQVSIDQLAMLLEGGHVHPALAELKSLPRYREFLSEFHAALMAPETAAAPA